MLCRVYIWKFQCVKYRFHFYRSLSQLHCSQESCLVLDQTKFIGSTLVIFYRRQKVFNNLMHCNNRTCTHNINIKILRCFVVFIEWILLHAFPLSVHSFRHFIVRVDWFFNNPQHVKLLFNYLPVLTDLELLFKWLVLELFFKWTIFWAARQWTRTKRLTL